MTLLHLSSALSWRGGEQQLAYLVEELSAKGLQQHVLCARGSALAAYCHERRWEHSTYRKGFSVNPLAARAVARICRSIGADLVHVHDSHAHTFACLAASLFGNRIPIVLSRRVDFSIGGNALSRWKYDHPQVKKILCVSEAIRQIVLPAIRRPERLAVVHSGIDPERFRYGASGILRKQYQLHADRPIIANVAAIAPHKDYFTFVDTVEILVNKGHRASFLIIGGDGGEENSIRAYIREKGLVDQIVLTGFRNDIPRILPEIDLLLFTSKTEGLGTTVLDAFACGVPVVATAAGGIPEMVEEGVSGLLAPVGDTPQLAAQVERLLSEPSLRERLLAGAHKRLALFTKEAMAARTLEIYRQL